MAQGILKKITLVAVAVAMFVSVAALSGCSNTVTSEESGTATTKDSDDPIVARWDTSEGVAATVNGSAIGERSVTATIENYRLSNGLEEDLYWAEWLSMEGQTPESYRELVIEDYIEVELLAQAAEELGVEVTEEEIDEYKLQQYGEMTDEEWQAHLDRFDMTDDRYRASVEKELLVSKVLEAVSSDGSLTWSQYLEQLKSEADITINDMPSGLSYDVDMDELLGGDGDAE